MLSHAIEAVHQKAGDLVYVPGGWWFASKNLTDTTAFGSSMIRTCKLQRLESHLLGRGEDVGEVNTCLNLLRSSHIPFTPLRDRNPTAP